MQRFPIYLPLPHLQNLSSYQLPHETGLFLTTDELILTYYNRPKSIVYQDSLLLLYILWVYTNVQWHVFMITVSQRVVSLLKILCALPIHPPTPLNPCNHWFSLPLQFCVSQSVTQLESYSRQPFRLTSFTQYHAFKFPLNFYGLTAHFFLTLSNIPLFGYTTIYLSILLLKDILVSPKFGNYE